MTELLHLQDSYLRECEARVLYSDGKEVMLDQTVLYPQGGGQPTDTGTLFRNNDLFKVLAVKKKDGDIVHELDREGLLVGDAVKVVVDWERRYRHMRMHTAAHLLSTVAYKEIGLLITGNQLGADKSRLDFNLEQCDRSVMQSIVDKTNALITKGAKTRVDFLPREEALKIPSVIKLAGAFPPNIPTLRILSIGDFDRQADGGTHVADIREIGKIIFLGIDNKGKNNRRLYFSLEPA
jgi:Ser-tRNA(Ala) deacylase AlaX